MLSIEAIRKPRSPFDNLTFRNPSIQTVLMRVNFHRVALGRSTFLVEPQGDIITNSVSPGSQGSRLPVRHRFTIDDQILAGGENMLSARPMPTGLQEPGCNHEPLFGPSQSFYKGRDDLSEGFGIDRRRRIENQQTDLTGSFTSNPTDSDLLPQTRKISRRIPPPERDLEKRRLFATLSTWTHDKEN